MQCQFCRSFLEDNDALQEHQALSCPAVHQQRSLQEPENATVQFKWLVDRVMEQPTIFLICSDMIDNIELKRSNGCYLSDNVPMNTGKFNGQLVIDDDLVPVAPFEIDFLSEMIFLVVEKDSTTDDITSSYIPHINSSPRQHAEFSPRSNASSRSNLSPRLTESPRVGMPQRSNRGATEEESLLSPLHQEMIDHQVRHPEAGFGDLLDSDNVQSRQGPEFTSPRSDLDMRQRTNVTGPSSPEDHTFLNVDDLGTDHYSARDHIPQEHQQPVESEAEDVITPPRGHGHQLIDDSNSSLEISPRGHNGRMERSVDDMLQELSMTDHDDIIVRQSSNPVETEGFDDLQGLAPLPSEPSFQATASDALQEELEDAMRDITPNEENNGDSGHTPCENGQRNGQDTTFGNSGTGSADGYASDASSLATPIRVQTIAEVANERRALSRENSRENSNRRRSSRSRNLSLSSQRSQDQPEEEENVISELTVKCASLESEVKRLQKEQQRLLELTENYKEVKQELETKCCSYDEEIDRLKEKLDEEKRVFEQELLSLTNSNNELDRSKTEAFGELQKAHEELHKMSSEYEQLLTKMSNDDAEERRKEKAQKTHQITELYAKCESFEMEVVRLKNENLMLKKQKLEDGSSRRNDLKFKFHELETENKRLLSECQSLEAAQKLHEEDVTKEREMLEKKIKELEIENTELNVKCLQPSRVSTSQTRDLSRDTTSRMNIDKLKTENEVLKEKLRTIRIETEITSSRTNHGHGLSSNSTYQPHILSPRNSNNSKSRHSESYSFKLPRTPILPNRLDYNHQDSDSNGDATYTSRHSHHGNPYAAPIDTSPIGATYLADTDVSARPYRGLSSDHLFADSDHMAEVRKRYSSSPSVDDTRSKYSRRPHSFNEDFSSGYHPKSRSLDVGLDEIGYQEEPSYLRKKYNSLTRIPFCPTSARDISIGMQVSVNRSSGRLSRGIVKWIGTLPRHLGDYIGVELESESGKHDGYFDGARYFKCKPNRGVFVKFPKVIMAWK